MPTVCHYTSFESFQKILSTRQFHVSDYRDMNDSEEFIYSKKLMRSILRPHFDKIVEDYIKETKKTSSYELKEFVFEKILSIVYNDKTPFYLLCASKRKNDGWLSMWRSYGRPNDGVGIVFNVIKKETTFDNKVKYRSNLDKEDKDKLKALDMKGFINIILNYHSIKNESLSIDYKNEIDYILEIATKYKHPGFKDEREFRKVFHGGEVKYKDKNGKKIRYIECSFDLSCIKKILIGPSNAQHELYQKVQMEIEKYDLKVPIIKSSIPFLWDH